jgi:hypothetical protein
VEAMKQTNIFCKTERDWLSMLVKNIALAKITLCTL